MYTLKRHVIFLFRPKPKSIFGLHDPLGLHYLFQLRMSLSHKRRFNFIDTPSDICHCNQGSDGHFIFLCPIYATHRAALLASVNEILLKKNLYHLGNQLQLYLYGHESISYSYNRKILLSTIKYIT